MNEVSSQPDCDGRLRRLFAPHIESFDYALDAGLEQAVAALEPEEVAHPSADSTTVLLAGVGSGADRCARTTARYRVASGYGRVNAARAAHVPRCPACDTVPAAGRRRCGAPASAPRRSAGDGRLETVSPARTVGGFLVRRHEEATECGGYFIVNGNERLIRLLVVPRRNHVVAISRPTYRNRGPGFTQYATVIRCARPDQSSQTVALHLLEGGDAKLRLTVSKQEFLCAARAAAARPAADF